MEWVLIRVTILCVMLGVLAYQDIRTRSTSDEILIIFGAVGGLTYFFDWGTQDMGYVIICIIGSVLGGFWLWKFSLFGTGDILVFIVATVVFPLYDGVPVMIPLIAAAVLLSGLYSVCVNVMYNTSDLLRRRLFKGVTDSTFRKTVAFFTLHRQRRFPRHVFLAQENTPDGIRLRFHQKDLNADFAPEKTLRKTVYVTPATPFMAFMFAMSLFAAWVIWTL